MPDTAIQVKPLLDVRDLAKDFDVSRPWLNRVLEGQPRQLLKAVDGVSFTINRGETLSLVGESGCGKSTVARMICGLYPPSARLGELRRRGPGHDHRPQPDARDAPAVPDDLPGSVREPEPALARGPHHRRADPLARPAHRRRGDREARGRAAAAGGPLAARHGAKYPHEFSGGQRQRISIARALSSNPEFLVCDEPTSALDVSVQAQILNLMKDLQREHGLTYLFISHNLAVVSHISTRVGVMYLGRIVEIAETRTLFNRPLHPYTQMLQSAIPDIKMSGKPRTPVAGEVPNPLNPPTGCTFHPRCPFANDRCKAERPELKDYAGTLAACHGVEEKRIPIHAAA